MTIDSRHRRSNIIRTRFYFIARREKEIVLLLHDRSIPERKGFERHGSVPSPLPQQGLTRRYLCLAALDPAFDDSRSGVNPPPSPLRLAIIGWLHSPLTLLPFPPRPQRGRRQEKRNRNLRNDLSRSRSSSVDRSNEKRTFVSFHSRDSMKGRERERHKNGSMLFLSKIFSPKSFRLLESREIREEA